MKSISAIAGAVAGLAALAQAQTGWPASGPDICNVGSTANVRPSSLCGDFGARASCEDASLSLAGAVGEVLSAQLLLRKEVDLDDAVGGLHDVSITFADLEKLKLASVPQVFLAGFVLAKRSPRYEGSGCVVAWGRGAVSREPVFLSSPLCDAVPA